jgi:hypothetical protein
MLSFDDRGMTRIFVAACGIPREDRQRWLTKMAERLEALGQPVKPIAPVAPAGHAGRQASGGLATGSGGTSTPDVSAAAARQRRRRERRRQGRAVLRVDVNRVDLAEALVEEGLLREWDSEDPAAIQSAVEQLLDVLVGRHA